MKKLLFIAMLVMTVIRTTHAQYFHHKYGYAPDIGTVASMGKVASTTGTGHLMSGNHSRNLGSIPLTGDFGAWVLRTDINGRLSGPTNFNNSYLFQASTGMELRFTNGVVVEEYADGSGYAVVATYFHETLQQNQGIAFFKLDLNGNVLFVKAYKMPNSTARIGLSTSALKRSTSKPSDFFATGQYFNDISNYVWSIRFDQNGSQVWGGLYDLNGPAEMPADLVESPYSSELLIVGSYQLPTTDNAFMLVLNSTTGGVITADRMSSGAVATWEMLHSVDVSNDPANPGFIFSGISDSRLWVSKLGPFRNFQWSRRYQPIGIATDYMYGYDVVGRLNTSNQYEYYATGPLNEDAYIMKLNNVGAPAANGLFVYDIGVEETGLEVDVKNIAPDPGVTMYAVAEDDPLRQAYMVKAYFNGVSGCNESFYNASSQSLQFNPVTHFTVGVSSLLTEVISFKAVQNNTDTEICYRKTIAGGSNARFATSDEGTVRLSPNPITMDALSGKLMIAAAVSTSAQVVICDIVGKVYYTNTFVLREGRNELNLDLNNSGMSMGIYTVKITGEQLNSAVMLFVK